MDVIPSLDLLSGNVVRLRHGDFTHVTAYGDPETVLRTLDVPRGSRLHLVDLEASRTGRPIETAAVRRLAHHDLRVQVGGGIRSVQDAQTWLDCGAEKIVVGTVAADAPEMMRALVEAIGAERIIAAVSWVSWCCLTSGALSATGWTATPRNARRT